MYLMPQWEVFSNNFCLKLPLQQRPFPAGAGDARMFPARTQRQPGGTPALGEKVSHGKNEGTMCFNQYVKAEV